MDGAPLSELDLARLKAHGSQSAVEPVAIDGRRAARRWRQTLPRTAHSLARELQAFRASLPALLRGDVAFSLMLWVAVFSVAAAVVADPGVPLPVRYAAGLAALAYLYACTELTRMARPVAGRDLLLGVADLAVVMALGALSVAYVPTARVLLFFGAARIAGRFRDPRILAVGLVLIVPFEVAAHPTPLSILFEIFPVLMTMWLVVYLTSAEDRAREAIARQTALAELTSGLARAQDEEAVFAQLASQALPLVPGCAWAFWTKDPANAADFHSVRWAGLGEGDLPGFTFSPALGADPTQSVVIDGPLPGTGVGNCTLIQPTQGDGDLNGLITVAGRRADLRPEVRALIRSVGDEMGASLLRLQTLDQARQRTEAMEQANRLAGMAAGHAADQRAALAAMRSAVAEVLRSESLHLEWVDGDRLEIVIDPADPLGGHAPTRFPLAGTRTAEALLQGRALREPLTGRRPEDLFGVPAGLSQVAVAPLRRAGIDGTLQVARRLPRAYAASEVLVLQLLAERLGLIFAAGLPARVANSTPEGVSQ